jgi:predicted transcriptional regulator
MFKVRFVFREGKEMTEPKDQSELLALTTNIIASHVSNNPVSGDNLTKMIREVYETLSKIETPSDAKSERSAPMVPVKKSVTPDYDRVRYDARAISGTMGLARRLSDGCT